MNKRRGEKNKAKSKVDQYLKSVFIKKPITNLERTKQGGWRATFGTKKDGSRDQRRWTSSREQAEQIVQLWNRAIAEGNSVNADALTQMMALNTAKAIELMKNKPYDILDAVEFFLEHMPDTRLTVLEAIDVYIDYQKQRGNRETSTSKSHSNFKTYYKPLVDEFGDKELIELTPNVVEAYFKKRGKNWSAKTFNSHKNRLSVFWNKLAEKDYCSSALNPFAKLVTKNESKSAIKSKVSSPNLVREYFKWAEADCKKYPTKYPELALAVITFFCGIRVEEVSRVKWSSIKRSSKHDEQQPDFSGWTITVDADIEKTGTGKINPIPFNAQCWIELIEQKTRAKKINMRDKLTAGDWKQRKKKFWTKFKDETGYKLPQNTARHTWASMHLALHKLPQLTAQRLGHRGNPETLEQHYKDGNIESTAAEEFFEIIPSSVDPKTFRDRIDEHKIRLMDAKVAKDEEEQRIKIMRAKRKYSKN